MSVKKFQGDGLFTGTEMLDAGQVLITNQDGRVIEIVPAIEAGDDVQQMPGILCPGFINCHCHLELSHMKGLIPEKTGLIDFVYHVVTQRHFAEEEILQAIALGEEEMLANGIVAVGDICNNSLTLPQKILGNIDYYNFIEATGWLPGVATERFTRSKSFYDAYAARLPQNAIIPHAPYSVSELLWQQINPYFKNKVVSIHNQETAFEDEFFMQGTGDFLRMYQMMKIDNAHHVPNGKSSLQSYFNKLAGAKNVLLVHNTYSTKNDIQFANMQAEINQQQLFWCLCINANLYIENKMPPIEDLLAEKSRMVIGTDSLASNWSLSVLDELKTIHEQYKEIPIASLLQWATHNGAAALQMTEKLGSFEKGKQPGVLFIENDLSEVKRMI